MQSESQLRRNARANGLPLRKVPERSRSYAQQGPYLLIDASTKTVSPSGLSLEAVLEAVAAELDRDATPS
jgi:hypothetical protein